MDIKEASQIHFFSEVKHWWIKTRFLYLQNAINMTSPSIVKEYGFGTGQNLWKLEKAKKIKAIYGIDPHWNSTLNYSHLSRTKLLQQDDKNIHADLMIAMDVIEHIDDDKQAILQWRESLKDKGHIFITVPAFLFLWSKHDEFLGHKRRYTKKELNHLMTQCGFKKVYSFYIFSYMFLPVFILRKFILKNQNSSDLKPTNLIFNTLFYILGVMEKMTGGNAYFGTSVVGLYQKDTP